MLLVLGAIGVYCLISAAVVVFLCMNASRLNQRDGWEEDWSAAELQSEQARVSRPVSGEATMRA